MIDDASMTRALQRSLAEAATGRAHLDYRREVDSRAYFPGGRSPDASYHQTRPSTELLTGAVSRKPACRKPDLTKQARSAVHGLSPRDCPRALPFPERFGIEHHEGDTETCS